MPSATCRLYVLTLSVQVRKFENFWFEVLKLNGLPLGDFHSASLLKLPDIAKPIISKSMKQAQRLLEIAALNRKVHVTRYNKIIGDCVAVISRDSGSQ